MFTNKKIYFKYVNNWKEYELKVHLRLNAYFDKKSF